MIPTVHSRAQETVSVAIVLAYAACAVCTSTCGARTAIGRLYAEKEHDHHLAQQLLPLGVRLARAGSPCGEALDPTSLKLRPVDPYARRGEAKCVCDNSIGGGDC